MDLASFFQCTLETRWLGVRKPCGIGLFYRNYKPLSEETGWLGADFISVCLETRWLGQKQWVRGVYFPERPCMHARARRTLPPRPTLHRPRAPAHGPPPQPRAGWPRGASTDKRAVS